jgi:hypothetical protein
VDAIHALYAKYGIDVDSSNSAAGGDEAPATPMAAGATGAKPAPRAARAESAVVWKLEPDKTIVPVQIALGLTDHAYTEVTRVLKGTLAVGDEVVTGSLSAATSGPPGTAVRR